MIAPDTESSLTEAVPPDTPGARDLARRLIARETGPRDAPDIGTTAAQLACERVYRDLARWIGSIGCHALFTRAVGQTQDTHPFLSEISIDSRSEPRLSGVIHVVEAHGVAQVAAALESLLAEVLELLGRLIGDDVTARLVEPKREPQNGQGSNDGSV